MKPAEIPSTVSAQIREQEQPTLKFRSEYVDVLENNRRVEVITEAEARRRLVLGGFEAVGHNTVKYIRRLPRANGPIDGPLRKSPPRASDNYTVMQASNRFDHRFIPTRLHPWRKGPRT
jgi:hypothetical protein